ncbi:hypothetical protein VNO77_42495 [Canavalia gladiata]|uniref:Uncharacterized protein n=1 Tax=Canavalia gladiata TaxID=3824 RepID=A0AAN9PNH0_CANGL
MDNQIFRLLLPINKVHFDSLFLLLLDPAVPAISSFGIWAGGGPYILQGMELGGKNEGELLQLDSGVCASHQVKPL